MSNVNNYLEQGGDRWVVGGSLEVVEGGALVVQGSELELVAGQVDSSATTIAELKKDFNDLLAALYAAGLMVADKSELLDEISSALELLGEAVVGEDAGEYPQAAYDAFEADIETAQGVADKEKARQTEVNTAKTTLLAAVSAFEATVITE